jgi:ubiquinol oxidase
MAGSVLLRHAGASRRLFSATAASPAAAAARPLLAGGEGSWARLMSTSAAKDQAAKAADAAAVAGKGGDGEKKEVAVNSYWGIEQSQTKLVREDGTEWKWSCFKVRTPRALALCFLCSRFSVFDSLAADRRIGASCVRL